jgi:hypothetical protein
MDRTRSTNRTEEECIRDLVANPERTRPVGRARHIWQDSIEIYI